MEGVKKMNENELVFLFHCQYHGLNPNIDSRREQFFQQHGRELSSLREYRTAHPVVTLRDAILESFGLPPKNGMALEHDLENYLTEWAKSFEETGSSEPEIPSLGDFGKKRDGTVAKEATGKNRPIVPKLINGKTVSYLPIDYYGKLAKKVVTAYSDAFLVNPDLLAATILMAVASAANKKMVLRLANYINRPCIWLCVVAVSGYNKTTPMSRVLKPLEAINEDLVNSYKMAYSEWKKNGEQGNPPDKRQLILTDSTPEARDELLKNCGLLLYRDEVFGLFKDFNRYNTSGEIENLLSTWSGKSYAINRKTTSSFFVKDPHLSIYGGIQPDVMRDAFGGKTFEGSGFLGRWLFLWISDTKVPDCVSQDIVSPEIESEWNAFLQNLWRAPSREFRLDEDAIKVYDWYMKSTADTMNSESCEDSVRNMLGKLRIYAQRLALVIHLLRNGIKAPDLIDRHTMYASVRTCHCFEHWGRKVLDEISDKNTAVRLTNSDLLREFVSRYGVKNQSELARLIGKSQQYVSGVLNNRK